MSTLTITALLFNLSLGADAEFLRAAKAIMKVESGGDPYAVGDGGAALGPYQIHRAYWTDAMRLLGQTWPYQDARDPVKALVAVWAYTRHYAQHHRRPWTAETIARIHNGGPRGWSKPATLRYWRKVQTILSVPTKRPEPPLTAATSAG